MRSVANLAAKRTRQSATRPGLKRTAKTGHYWYLIDLTLSGAALGGNHFGGSARPGEERLALHVVKRNQDARGRWSAPEFIAQLPPSGAPSVAEQLVWDAARMVSGSSAFLGAALAQKLLPALANTGRLGGLTAMGASDVLPLQWAGGAPWQLVVEPLPSSTTPGVCFGGFLRRGKRLLPLDQVQAALVLDFAVTATGICRLQPGTSRWLHRLLLSPLTVSKRDLPEFLLSLSMAAAGPTLGDVSSLGFKVVSKSPRPVLRLKPRGNAGQLQGTLLFSYGKASEVGAEARATRFLDTVKRHLVRRNTARETAAVRLLDSYGFHVSPSASYSVEGPAPMRVRTSVDTFLSAAGHLLDAGWRVEVEGTRYRRATRVTTMVASEQDWFNVKGKAEFGAQVVELPELLQAIRHNQRWITLGDGSRGLLPEAWIAQLGGLAALHKTRNRELKLHRTHALMCDGLLSLLPDLQTDAGFADMCARMQALPDVAGLPEPPGFRGELRDYQRVALGWLQAIERLGFGGCLADDMGLGKTVVVVAWLLTRKHTASTRGAERPSLLVVPKSLLFNWQAECARFAPGLRLTLHHGVARTDNVAHLEDFDVVLTSYGTLRRDAALLGKQTFDYVVLDEAHQIKNATTEAHRVARSLACHRRLALTGTPVENHLGELWSLLTYLNPGFFAPLAHLKKVFVGRRPTETALQNRIIAATRPFTLRRTKEDVAPELPERVDQTVYVEQSGAEKKLYQELYAHYRQRMLERKQLRRDHGPARTGSTSGGNGKLAAESLEALLRLRQAACHPGLIEEARRGQSSAKLDLLLERLEKLAETGHKALVFSQFTSLLAIAGQRLKERGLSFATLDGKTANRQAVVARFQDDPTCPIFLISLKAGGVGLNLTAADYVFILDPWWNPAAEAQAIDRAHRIGQRKTVIACRLLTRNTVEEKVANLQKEKQQLAAAIFGDPKLFAARFTQEDLESLLS